jgi:hypothetical protein
VWISPSMEAWRRSDLVAVPCWPYSSANPRKTLSNFAPYTKIGETA